MYELKRNEEVKKGKQTLPLCGQTVGLSFTGRSIEFYCTFMKMQGDQKRLTECSERQDVSIAFLLPGII